jgi:hypothetical protein
MDHADTDSEPSSADRRLLLTAPHVDDLIVGQGYPEAGMSTLRDRFGRCLGRHSRRFDRMPKAVCSRYVCELKRRSDLTLTTYLKSNAWPGCLCSTRQIGSIRRPMIVNFRATSGKASALRMVPGFRYVGSSPERQKWHEQRPRAVRGIANLRLFHRRVAAASEERRTKAVVQCGGFVLNQINPVEWAAIVAQGTRGRLRPPRRKKRELGSFRADIAC